MTHFRRACSALLLPLLLAPLSALASPIGALEFRAADYDAYRTGYVASPNPSELDQDFLDYDAAAGLLSGRAFGTGTFYAPIFPADGFEYEVEFFWQVGVDRWGRVTDGGSLEWYGDLGDGLELLATGRATDLGFEVAASVPRSARNTFYGLRILFAVDYLSTALDGMGNRLLLYNEQYMRTPFLTPFFQDFSCPGSGGTVLDCSVYSDGGFVGLNKIPDPPPWLLLATSLVLMGALRGRPSRV